VAFCDNINAFSAPPSPAESPFPESPPQPPVPPEVPVPEPLLTDQVRNDILYRRVASAGLIVFACPVGPIVVGFFYLPIMFSTTIKVFKGSEGGGGDVGEGLCGDGGVLCGGDSG
ncbi:hypothetical protein Tco_0936482, partial [Tanacetum coccineum]